MELLYERIKEARMKKGLSQKKTAEMMEISQPGYQQIESGKFPDMRISTLLKLCETLDASADWLLGLTDTTAEERLAMFYIGVIDTIAEFEEAELIEDSTSYSLMRSIDAIKRKCEDIM